VLPWTQLDVDWVPALDLEFHLGVDGVSYPLLLLTALLTLLCCAYTVHRVPAGGSGRSLAALLLVLEVGILGTFLALDLVLFFLFFEVVLLPMYAVIVGWGGDDRRHAARKFVLYTLFGSVLLLLGVFTVVAATGTADIVELTGGVGMSRTVQLTAFGLFAVAFAVKAPLWPLHTWLPDAHTQAPTVGSVVLAGVLLKMGTYGLIRVAVGVAPQGARWAAPALGVLAVAAIIIGSLVCLRQTEIKRLIAYSSVGHMGFVLLGIATLTATGLQAALIGNVAHGVITGLLFFLAGALKDRAHTGELAELGGLRESAPRLAGLLGFAAVASLGLPGLAGFWGEAFAVVAAVQRGGPLWITLAVLAAAGGALTAAYFLRLLRRVTHGPASSAVAGLRHPRPSGAEWLAWAPLVVLALAIGLVPALVLAGSAGPVDALTGVLR
jgi:NADH-quinone oxidoreductase subunit M